MTKRFRNIVVFAVIIFLCGLGTALASGHGSGTRAAKAQKTMVQAQIDININSATAKELTHIRGIGPKTAEAIVQYRKEHGPFKKASDIQHVKGVGRKTFEKIRDHITIRKH